MNQNLARPPAALPPTPLQGNETTPLTVSLLLGSFEHSPYSLELFDLYLPPSQPAPEHPDEKTFHPQPEIQHTFRPEQKVPSKFVSGLAALLVGAGPWMLLLGLVCFSTLTTVETADTQILVLLALASHALHAIPSIAKHSSLHCLADGPGDTAVLLLGQPQAGTDLGIRCCDWFCDHRCWQEGPREAGRVETAW